MNWSVSVWPLLFIALTGALLFLPFYPAWHEWRQPADALALPLNKVLPDSSGHLPANVRLHASDSPRADVRASALITVASGSHFQKLAAPTIFLGTEKIPRNPAVDQALGISLLSLPHARKWGDKGWHIDGDCHIPQARHLQGDLVVMGALTLGADCLIEGSIKAHGTVQVGPRSHIRGALFSDRAIVLHDDVHIQGPVVSDKHLILRPGVVVGRPDAPSTLHGARILASPGAVVHGAVWAKTSGRVS